MQSAICSTNILIYNVTTICSLGFSTSYADKTVIMTLCKICGNNLWVNFVINCSVITLYQQNEFTGKLK